MKISNLRVIEIEEGDCYQFKGPESIFNKLIEENILNLKTETAINVQEGYNTPNRLDQYRKSSSHIISKTVNVQKIERKYYNM